MALVAAAPADAIQLACALLPEVPEEGPLPTLLAARRNAAVVFGADKEKPQGALIAEEATKLRAPKPRRGVLVADISVPEALPEEFAVAFCVRNTFIECTDLRADSLEDFYHAREVISCPASNVGRLAALFAAADEPEEDVDGDASPVPPPPCRTPEPPEPTAPSMLRHAAALSLHGGLGGMSCCQTSPFMPVNGMADAGFYTDMSPAFGYGGGSLPMGVPFDHGYCGAGFADFVAPQPMPPMHAAPLPLHAAPPPPPLAPFTPGAAALLGRHEPCCGPPPPYSPGAPALGGIAASVLAASAAEFAPPAGPAPGGSEMPSVGSAGHAAGRCKPCAFLHTKGCENGLSCQFCHLCEAGEKKRRQKEKLNCRRTAHKLKQVLLGADASGL